MSENDTPFTEKTIGFRILVFLLILIFIVAIIVMSFFAGGGLFDALSSLKQNRITVYVNNWDFPILFTYPGNIALIIMLLLRLFDLETQKRMNVCLKVIVVSAVLFIAIRIPYGFIASNYMESKGYSYCYYYTSAGARSDDVWVRDPAYCLEHTGSIRIDLLEWLNETQDAGQDPTPQEVRIKAEELFKADSVKKFRMKK